VDAPDFFVNISAGKGSIVHVHPKQSYAGRTESHEQLFFASELGTADEGE